MLYLLTVSLARKPKSKLEKSHNKKESPQEKLNGEHCSKLLLFELSQFVNQNIIITPVGSTWLLSEYFSFKITFCLNGKSFI